MTSSRRDLIKLTSAALAGAGLAACGSSASSTADTMKTAFLLVHGAWHGAWAYQKLIPELTQKGYAALAIDLPGHGLNARIPASYFTRDAATFASEPSPVAAVSVDQCADVVVKAIEQLRAGGFEKVVLVAHSAGGVAVTQALERIPEKVTTVVYLCAFMLANGQTALQAGQSAEGQTAKVPALLRADPVAVGALRADFASTDSAYLDQIKAAFYGDVANEALPAIRNLLTPDAPVALSVTPAQITAGRWGSVRRHYIKCTGDQAIPVALQQKFIDEADKATPLNKTIVQTMNTSHSPFLSAPTELSTILSAIAANT